MRARLHILRSTVSAALFTFQLLMILEKAVLDVKLGEEAAFESDFARASTYISSINGYISHELHRCVEVRNRYLLLAYWSSIEAHTVGFRQSDAYGMWKELLHHYYSPFPTVEHYERVNLH
jgi:heme-degrading monooxygenase HmoA